MSFLWPEMLWLLLALPALVGVYVWVLRRKKRLAHARPLKNFELLWPRKRLRLCWLMKQIREKLLLI